VSKQDDRTNKNTYEEKFNDSYALLNVKIGGDKLSVMLDMIAAKESLNLEFVADDKAKGKSATR
jgi:hypothetical protein